MKLKYLLFACLMLVVAFSSCKSDLGMTTEEQLAADEIRIKEFVEKNDIPALRHESGVYYQILAPGAGEIVYTGNTRISAKYALRLLNGNSVPQPTDPIDFSLGGVIIGWQVGIPMIQKGGKIRLIIPSSYAYGRESKPGIPSNSVLDFDIELVNAQN